MPKQIMTWYPIGRRKRKGRPKTYRMDEIKWNDERYGTYGRGSERQRAETTDDNWENLNGCRRM